MKLVKEIFSNRYEVKKSIFISFLAPFSKFDNLKEKLKYEHPKATHIVYAYRKLNEFDQIVENQSDDNEPKGCAGQPTLAVLRGEDIINTALLTVRYFGGTKLGVGGMIRGYSSAAKGVIDIANFVEYEKRFLFEFETPYSLVNRYEHFLNSKNINFTDREFGANSVLWKLNLTQDQIDNLQLFKKSL
jgi:uncharacterized YigZ family protein